MDREIKFGHYKMCDISRATAEPESLNKHRLNLVEVGGGGGVVAQGGKGTFNNISR
jgi:hypothetical protein